MTSPYILKRNLRILKLYDAGKLTRKELAIRFEVAIQVIHDVIHKRNKYEMDIRTLPDETKKN